MIQFKTLVRASLAISVAMAAVALLMRDWMWFVVVLLSILLLLLPYYKDVGYYYSRNVIWMSMLAPALVVAYYLVDHLVYPVGGHIFLDVSYTEYFNAAFQALECFLRHDADQEVDGAFRDDDLPGSLGSGSVLHVREPLRGRRAGLQR